VRSRSSRGRGVPFADAAALSDAIVERARRLHAFPDEIAEIDINPLTVHANGCVAADTLVRGHESDAA